VTLTGRDAEVELRREGDGVVLEMDGRTLAADFRRLPDGEVYSLLIDGRSHQVRVSPAGPGLEVTIQGATLPVEVRHPLERLLQTSTPAASRGAGETIAAPMPGLVVAVRVKPGEKVMPGQPVAVVEAMKMQNELGARHGGVVSEVLVTEGASVNAGQPLVRLEAQA
jgi:biotin carboxyl carrier protein